MGAEPCSSPPTVAADFPQSQEVKSSVDLSMLPSVYVLSTHIPMDELHALEDQLLVHNAPLTYDIKEAKIILGKVRTKKRAQLDLRVGGLWTVEATQNALPAEVLEDEEPPRKRKRTDTRSGRSEPASMAFDMDSADVESDVEDDAHKEVESAARNLGVSLSYERPPLSEIPFPSFDFVNRVKVVKLEWFRDCVIAGEVLPLDKYVVYEGVPSERPEAPSTPVLSSAMLPSSSPMSTPSPKRTTLSRTIIERAKEDSGYSGQYGSWGPSGYQARKFINQESGPRWQHDSPHTHAQMTRLLQQTTTEHDEGDLGDIPEPPDWVKQDIKYACQRSTPMNPPNEDFIAQLRKIKMARLLTNDEIGVRAYSTSIAAIAAYPYVLTSPREILQLPGCDVKIANLWVEWKNTSGRIKAVEDADNDEALTVLRLFYEIWGVGATTAREFYYDKGWRDLDDIVEFGWSTLQRVQQIGVKYYDEFLVKIPRDEVEFIADKVREHAIKVRDEGIETVIVGGYRRGKKEAGDVDMIVSHRDPEKTLNLVTDIVASLEEEGWITHTLLLSLTNTNRGQSVLPFKGTTSHGHGFDTLDKALVVWQDPKWSTKEADLAANPKAKNPNIHRRVDIIIAPWRTVGCAVAGWSGETTFQRDLRRYAKATKGWKFDSSGVRSRTNGEVVDLEGAGGISKTWQEAERKVFDGLGLVFREPWERCTG